ncbi:MAG: hypothetical protein M1837_003081, partial [Sclerophora amabilis]
MALATAATVAGSSAVAAYLDAKFQIRKDIISLVRAGKAERQRRNAVRARRESIWYFFESRCERYPGNDCIWSRSGCYTSHEAYQQSCRYAQWFLSQGLQPGDMAAIYMQNSPEFMFAWFGLWAIGCAPALINHSLGGSPLLHCLKVANAKLLLVDEEIKDKVLDIRDLIVNELGMSPTILDDQLKREIFGLQPERPDDRYRVDVKGEDPMCLLYTSGTTGMPKACVYPTSRGFSMAYLQTRMMDVTSNDRWYDCMPLYHGTGAISALIALLSGLTLCIGKKFSVSKFWDDITDSRATWFTYVGETARYLLAAPPNPRDRDNPLRGMWGNGLRPDVWARFRDRFDITIIYEFFNSSEGVFSLSNPSYGDYRANAVGHHGLPLRLLLHNTYVPVAIDVTSNQLYRSPTTGFAVRQPYSAGGEILVKLPSESAFPGYYGNPTSTSAKFERNVFREGDLYYRTGDALRRDEEGRWFFLDRLGDTFRWKSENVSTAEVAEVLGEYPGVVEANVYGVLVPGHEGRAGCAALYIEPGEREKFNYQGLLRHAQRKLPDYAVPVFLRIVGSLSPMHNNKQNKVPLRDEGVDPQKVQNGRTGDVMLWIVKEGGGRPGSTVEPFGESEWRKLGSGG